MKILTKLNYCGMNSAGWNVSDQRSDDLFLSKDRGFTFPMPRKGKVYPISLTIKLNFLLILKIFIIFAENLVKKEIQNLKTPR